MTYSDALFFVGKCLTLGYYPDRIGEVREAIRSGSVAWEQIVWVSTGQYVFPALYLQLKRAGLLPELPPDLVEYLEEFTSMNRERNRQIIDQALEITALLNDRGISPIFLKGTAHLLDVFYEDIAERMVGDIDFLVSEADMYRAAEILTANGYSPSVAFNPLDLKRTRHYTLLVNPDRRAGVEVHRQTIIVPHQKQLDFEMIAKKIRKLNLPGSVWVPADEYQILHNMLGFQLNDRGYYYGTISLRQSYDLLLLSKRENPLTVAQNFGKFFNCLNVNLAASNKLFSDPACLPYEQTWQAKIGISRTMLLINHPGFARFSRVVLFIVLRLSHYAKEVILAIFNTDARQSLFARLSDPEWYGKHLRSYRKIG